MCSSPPWGAGPDLYRVLDFYNSAYVKPVGDTTNGHPSRWSSPEMDAVIEKLRQTDPSDAEATIAVGIEGLKIAVTELPGIPTFGYIGFITWDQTYWTNWPTADNLAGRVNGAFWHHTAALVVANLKAAQ